MIGYGQSINGTEFKPAMPNIQSHVRAYSLDGQLLAIMSYEAGTQCPAPGESLSKHLN